MHDSIIQSPDTQLEKLSASLLSHFGGVHTISFLKF